MDGRSMRRRFRRGYQFLGSPRLAAGLLALLAGLLLGNVYQVAWVERAWLLPITYSALFVSLLCYMAQRVGAALRWCRFPRIIPSVSPAWERCAVPGPPADAAAAVDLLRRQKYRTLEAGGAIYGLRGRFSIMGHWLLHASFLVLLGGGFWIALSPDPFRGSVGVGEQEPFDLHQAPFIEANRRPDESLPSLQFTIEKVDAETEGLEVRAFHARVQPPDGPAVDLAINRPYRQPPFQVLAQSFGYMPGWVLLGRRGRMIHGAWVKLMPFPHLEEESFPVGPGDSVVTVNFLPDCEVDGDLAHNRSYALRNPRFLARVRWKGEEKFHGLLAPEEKVPLGEGMEFMFLPEIRKYAMLDVVQERGYEVVFAGLGLAVAGVLLRFGRTRKEIVLRWAEDGWQVYGRGEMFASLFAEELGQLARRLAALGPGPRDK